MPYVADKWNEFQHNAVPADTEKHTAFALKGAFYSGISVALIALGREGISYETLVADCRAYANEVEEHSNRHH